MAERLPVIAQAIRGGGLGAFIVANTNLRQPEPRHSHSWREHPKFLDFKRIFDDAANGYNAAQIAQHHPDLVPTPNAVTKRMSVMRERIGARTIPHMLRILYEELGWTGGSEPATLPMPPPELLDDSILTAGLYSHGLRQNDIVATTGLNPTAQNRALLDAGPKLGIKEYVGRPITPPIVSMGLRLDVLRRDMPMSPVHFVIPGLQALLDPNRSERELIKPPGLPA